MLSVEVSDDAHVLRGETLFKKKKKKFSYVRDVQLVHVRLLAVVFGSLIEDYSQLFSDFSVIVEKNSVNDKRAINATPSLEQISCICPICDKCSSS